jgi:hypothetical protein
VSIDRETFENTSGEELADLSVVDRVLRFLSVHDDRAFEKREIATRTEIDPDTVATALDRLYERELVDHKATYWAVTSDTDRLDDFGGYRQATALFDEQFGREDAAAWREHAPDGPHPSVSGEQ